MPYWRLKGSRRSRGWIGSAVLLSFIALSQPAPGQAQTAEPRSRPGIRIVLVKISSHTEFQEIRETILTISGVTSIMLQTEARELITLRIDTSDSPVQFTEALKTTFAGRYTVTPKKLDSGILEINFVKAG
ncbi:MAG: hypothetical protein HYY44_07885 [Deltaproteobacteria bacterium]|nr:hypothetical protein [Deltaproteobacteria bacterium]